MEEIFLLTEEEAYEFIEKGLKINDAQNKLQMNPLNLVDEMMTKMRQRIPWQNISKFAVPPNKRDVPTYAQIKDDMLTGKGGNCVVLNVFFKVLLLRLGLKAFHFGVAFENDWTYWKSHISVGIRDLVKKGSIHLADVGLAYPALFTTIPLDFKGESPVHRQCGRLHKFVKNKDGTIDWFRDTPKKLQIESEDGASQDESAEEEVKWTKRAVLAPSRERSTSDYTEAFKVMFATDPTVNYPKDLFKLGATIYPNFQLFAIQENEILTSNDFDQIVRTPIETKQDLLKQFSEHFQGIPTNMVEDAYRYLGHFKPGGMFAK